MLMHEVPYLMEQFASIVDNPFQTSLRLKEVATNFLSAVLKWIKWGQWCWLCPNVVVLTEDLGRRENSSSQSFFGWISEEEGLSIEHRATIHIWLSTTQSNVVGIKRMAICFPFRPHYSSPRMFSIWMQSVLDQIHALGANACMETKAEVHTSIQVQFARSMGSNNFQY